MGEVFCVDSKSSILAYNAISSLFMLVLFTILIYFNYIYQIGKSDMYMVSLSLAICEVIKYAVNKYFYADIKMGKTKRLIKPLKLFELFKKVIIAVTSVVIFYAISIVLGAELLSKQQETFMLSVLLTTLAIIPACIHLGSDIAIELFSNLSEYQGSKFSMMILRNTQLTLIGAWLGAIVIPLDWERPWQMWPIPCSFGALFGYTFSNIVQLLMHIK